MGVPNAEKIALLQDIWCDVLGTDAVHPADNFFILGGESLSAMTVVTRVFDLLGVEIGLEEVYRCNTFAEFAEHVLSMSST